MGHLTAQRLRSLLDYDAASGALTNKVHRGVARAGAQAGALHKDGCIVVRVDRRLYKAHRLAWLYAHGRWPTGEIDHIDGNRQNNSLCNLRDVARRVNQENVRTARSDNASGVLGVNKRGGSYRARIRLGGRYVVLGSFPTVDQAHAVYVAAKRQWHEGNTL